MKTIEEFVESLVKIELIEDANCFGHYPFQLFCEKNIGNNEINAISIGQISLVYLRFAEYKKNGAKRIYLSVDFPAGGDIDNDFVAIFSFENDVLSVFAIPYDNTNGEIFDVITQSTQLDLIKSQMLLHF